MWELLILSSRNRVATVGRCCVSAMLLLVCGGCGLLGGSGSDWESARAVWHKDSDGAVLVYRALCKSKSDRPADGFGVRVGRTDDSEPISIHGEYDWAGDLGRIYVLKLERHGVSKEDAQRVRDAWDKNSVVQIDVGDKPGTELTAADSRSLKVDRWVGEATTTNIGSVYEYYEDWLSAAEDC